MNNITFFLKATPSKTRKGKFRSTKLEGPNIVFESRIAELEAQLTQSKIDLKKLQVRANTKIFNLSYCLMK
jgi:hypothetical protein